MSVSNCSQHIKFLNFTIMLKNILNLKGAQELSKSQQISIKGGVQTCTNAEDCWDETIEYPAGEFFCEGLGVWGVGECVWVPA